MFPLIAMQPLLASYARKRQTFQASKIIFELQSCQARVSIYLCFSFIYSQVCLLWFLAHMLFIPKSLNYSITEILGKSAVSVQVL